MKKTTKKSKTSNPIRDKEIKGNLVERAEFMEFFAQKISPTPDAVIEKIADELVEWVSQNPEKVQLIDFYNTKGIFHNTMNRWAEKSEYVKKRLNWAKYTLGQRRELKALNKEFDPSFVRYTMPMFDDDFKAIEEWRSKLKGESEGSGDKIVVIEKFPETDVVPRLEGKGKQ